PDDVLRTDNRLPPKTMILGLGVEGANKAFPLNALRKTRVINETLGSQPVLIVHQPGSDTTTAFSARLNGTAMKFAAGNAEPPELPAPETHSTWDASGHCLAGKLKGSKLQPLILEPEYWFAWSEFHPGSAIYDAAHSEAR